MGTKFTATIATTNTDRQGDRFSLKALKGLTDVKAMRIKHDAGLAISGTLEGETVRIEALLNARHDYSKRNLYIVPTIKIKKVYMSEDGIRVIDDASLIELSLTSEPADSHLEPVIEIIEHKE